MRDSVVSRGDMDANVSCLESNPISTIVQAVASHYIGLAIGALNDVYLRFIKLPESIT
jgi:hypothetical protein